MGTLADTDQPAISDGHDHHKAAPPVGVDITKASIARVYDYVLGGKDNFAIDRSAAQAIIRAVPESALIARDNRAFVRRTVRFLVGEAGIRQIVDIGSGLPTRGNVHEIAHEVDPSARVLYVDKDPIVLTHGRALLADSDNSTVLTGDIRQPDAIFDDPVTRNCINDNEPFAVIVSGLLHHLSDEEDPWGIVKSIRERLGSGSYLMIANFLDSGEPRARALERAFLEGGLGTGRFRTAAQQASFFTDLEMVEPGLVPANQWRPDSETAVDSPVQDLYLGGVGRKR